MHYTEHASEPWQADVNMGRQIYHSDLSDDKRERILATWHRNAETDRTYSWLTRGYFLAMAEDRRHTESVRALAQWRADYERSHATGGVAPSVGEYL